MNPPSGDNTDAPATVAYRVGQLERDMDMMARKIDRLVWGLVTLTITIAGSAVVFALTVASLKGGG